MASRMESAKRRARARQVMSKLGRSSSVESQLSKEWGVTRRQARRYMQQALQEMTKDRPRQEENFALLEAVAWEGLMKAVIQDNHRAINAYLRTLGHIESNSRPAKPGEKPEAPADRESLLAEARKAAARTQLLASLRQTLPEEPDHE